MSPLPAQFTDRWGTRAARSSYEDAVCWHLLLGDNAGARGIAAQARQRLARFSGLQMTPERWLHVTVLLAGPVTAISRGDMGAMLGRAQAALSRTAPVTVTLGRVFFHPEAIALGISPADALMPVLEAAQAATREVTGTSGSTEAWAPHLTLCYSTSEQPAAPVIAELGKALPECEVTVDRLSLVVQHGPEQLWDWRIAGSARLLGALR
jgi:2'-5' RNA ligase